MPSKTDKYISFLSKTEKIKETIYGLVSLLAVCLGLWLHLEGMTALSVLQLILGAAIGLWLACFFADLLAHSITVTDRHERRHAYAHAFDASLGILHAARMPVVFLLFSVMDWLSVSLALLSSIIAIALQLVLFVLLSLYRKQNGWFANLLTIVVQLAVFALILMLKMGH